MCARTSRRTAMKKKTPGYIHVGTNKKPSLRVEPDRKLNEYNVPSENEKNYFNPSFTSRTPT